MLRFKQLFPLKRCVVIGMIHVGALPGTPNFNGSLQKLIDNACMEAEIYKRCSIDAVLVENMNDVPYVQPPNITPETTAIMTRVCTAIRNILPSDIKCGVQILAGGNKEALAVAQASDLNFIRCEGFVFGHVADEGFTNACAGELMRYRRIISAEDVLIFTDIKKKHSSHTITNDISIEGTAEAAEFFLSDGVIITGFATGHEANADEVTGVKHRVKVPVLVGSGVTAENLHRYFHADAVIVGTHLKEGERWQNNVCEEKVIKFMEKATKFTTDVKTSY